MAVITNGPQDTQLDKLDVVGFGGYFELFVASGMHRAVKPDPALFKIALDRLGVAPESTWHIGNSLSADVAGAKAAGLGAAVWLNRNGAVRTPEEPEPRARDRVADGAARPPRLRRSLGAEDGVMRRRGQGYPPKRTLETSSVISKRGAG